MSTNTNIYYACPHCGAFSFSYSQLRYQRVTCITCGCYAFYHSVYIGLIYELLIYNRQNQSYRITLENWEIIHG